MHYIDADETYWEKTKGGLNATIYIEQIQEVAPHKTTAEWPLTSHL